MANSPYAESPMKIIRLEVSGLSGDKKPIELDFHDDLNVLTGRNGSGKTTILKLVWYIISGNIEVAMRELPFTRVYLKTDEYEITVLRLSRSTARILFKSKDRDEEFEDRSDDDGDFIVDAEAQANDAVLQHGSSVFFPTFRRIEGGFTLSSNRRVPGALSSPRVARPQGDLEEALASLSRRLSNGDHTFVASLSTSDIVELLMRKYTEMSALSNALQTRTSQSIIERIKKYQYKEQPEVTADAILSEIRAEIEQLDRKRVETLAPLTAVQVLVQQLLQHSGIRLSPQLSFGDAATAINSDALSAGEKQMLSFVCYNAFTKESVFVIDEPELSLHVDWQRMLFPTLQGQGTSNQFLIATHSPFIYSKFPDKEIMLSDDRGAE